MLRGRADYRAQCRLLALLVVLPVVRSVAANAEDGSFDLSVLPGESRVISHARSASRDTGLLAYQVTPHVVLSTGGDFAFLGLGFRGLELRLGMFGLIEVQTAKPSPLNFMNVPGGPYLWRGLLGYSAALALDSVARNWLGADGALEVALSFRHESEHLTYSSQEVDPRYAGIPNIGDFVMPDIALSKGLGDFILEVRVQGKVFLADRAYTFGPGADLVLIWRAFETVQPFFSAFGEYLIGGVEKSGGEETEVEDNSLLRGLVGIIVPGRTADLQLALTLALGNDKGLLAYEEEFRFGWALRIGFFKTPLRQSR